MVLESGVTQKDLNEFLEEATLMKDFDHPNVLNLIGVVLKEGRPFVLLPLMEHGDLRNYLLNPSNVSIIPYKHDKHDKHVT